MVKLMKKLLKNYFEMAALMYQNPHYTGSF